MKRKVKKITKCIRNKSSAPSGQLSFFNALSIYPLFVLSDEILITYKKIRKKYQAIPYLFRRSAAKKSNYFSGKFSARRRQMFRNASRKIAPLILEVPALRSGKRMGNSTIRQPCR